jgi:hypothetical protein
VLRTESFDTLYSVVAQNLILWCGASCLPLRGRLHQQRLVGELLENPSMKNPYLGVMVVGARLRDARHSQLASSSNHSVWLIVAPG